MRIALIGLLLAVSAGCSHGMTVRGAVVQPARVPVRAFPHILVTSSDDPDAVRLADAVAEHLRESRSEVRRVRAAELASLRRRDRIGRATAVVHVAVALSRSDRPEWARRRLMTCGPLGCTDSQRPYIREVPLIVGDAHLRVLHGPSGRVLQREHVRDEESGLDELGARLRVIERLSQQVQALLDQRTEEVRVELFPIDRPEVIAALDAIESRGWRAGRVRLERFVRTERFEGMTRQHRAVVLYDLGQARRFDVSLPAEERFRLSSAALRRAVRLVPAPRYASALADLDAHRRSRAMVVEQQAATAHNFALARNGDERVPAPPVGYR